MAEFDRARRRVLIPLFLAGTAVALGLQAAFAANNGGPSALLHVGADADLRPSISEDFEELVVWDGQGHDGKFSYAIAREPLAPSESAVDHPAYRYRRYLYSLVAGGFGLLSPELTLHGLILLAAGGFGLGVAATADLGWRLGAGVWSIVAGAANVGVLSGVLHLTSDPLAFGLGMSGAALWLRDRKAWSLLALLLAVWTKEVYLLVPLGLAAWELWNGRRWRDALLVLGVPGSFVFVWSVLLILLVPDGSATNSALSAPFAGIVRAFLLPGDSFATASRVLTLVAAAGAAGTALAQRRSALATLTVPWVILMSVSHEHVWFQDSMRAFAPIFTFAVIGAGVLWNRRRSRVRSTGTTTQVA